MKINLAEIVSDERYGMPEAHVIALQKAAEKTNTCIGVRPVSRFAKYFIEEGYPTKSFDIKNKSSNLGVTAGLIPMLAVHGRPIEDDKKHQKMLDHAFHADPSLKPVALHVTAERIEQLQRLLGASFQVKAQDNPAGSYAMEWKRGDQTITAQAIPAVQSFDIFDEDGKPLSVLGKKIGNEILPITADYDLLVVCPSFAEVDFQYADKSPFRTQGSPEKNKSLVAESMQSNYEGPKENPKMGNINPRTAELTRVINAEIAVVSPERAKPGLEGVHHNAEFANPFADDLSNNVPALLVLPREMDFSRMAPSISESCTRDLTKITMLLVETPDEMQLARDCLLDEGYYWATHAKYSNDLPPFRSNSIAAAERGTLSRSNSVTAAESDGTAANTTQNLREALKRFRDTDADSPLSPDSDSSEDSDFPTM